MKSLAAAVLSLSAASVAQAGADLAVARAGSQPSTVGATTSFTGRVVVEPLFQATEPARASGAYVTFEPGARTAWHTHPFGQTLVVTAGLGRVQRWGGELLEIGPGDVVSIPPGVKHWHGAAPNAAMTHLAVQEQRDGKAVEWLEPVSDAQYGPTPATPATPVR